MQIPYTQEQLKLEADKGDSIAQYLMGYLAYKKNTDTSLGYARTWFHLAGNNPQNPSATALFNLGRLEEKGQGGPKEDAKAFRHYERAGSLGNKDAHMNAIKLLQQSDVIKKEIAKGIDANSSEATIQLRILYHLMVAWALGDEEAKNYLQSWGLPSLPELNMDIRTQLAAQSDSLQVIQMKLEEADARRKKAEADAAKLACDLNIISEEKTRLREDLQLHREKMDQLQTRELLEAQSAKEETIFAEQQALLDLQREEFEREKSKHKQREQQLRKREKELQEKGGSSSTDGDLSQQKAELQKIEQELKQRAQELEAEQKIITAKKEKLQKKRAQFSIEMNEAKIKIEQESKELLQRVAKEQENIKVQTNALHTEKQHLNSERTQLTQERAQLLQTKSELATQLDTLKKSLQEVEQQKLSNQKQRERPTSQLESQRLQQELAQLSQKEKDLQSKLQELKRLEQTIDQKQTQQQKQEQALVKKEAELVAREQQLEEQRAQASILGDQQERVNLEKAEADRWKKIAQKYEQEAKQAMARAEKFQKEAELKSQSAAQSAELLTKILEVQSKQNLPSPSLENNANSKIALANVPTKVVSKVPERKPAVAIPKQQGNSLTFLGNKPAAREVSSSSGTTLSSLTK